MFDTHVLGTLRCFTTKASDRFVSIFSLVNMQKLDKCVTDWSTRPEKSGSSVSK